jgi:hypothetical protein
MIEIFLKALLSAYLIVIKLESFAHYLLTNLNQGINAVPPSKEKPKVSLGLIMVGTTGIEPVTPAMSMQCSPAELRALVFSGLVRCNEESF